MVINWNDFTPVDSGVVTGAVDWSQFEPIKTPEPGVWSDIKNTLSTGFQGLALDAREIARRAFGEKFVGAVDTVDEWMHGKPSEEFIKGNIEKAQQALTPEMQSAMQKSWWDDEKNSLGEAWSDPRAYLGNVMQSLPGTAVTMFPALAVARGMYAAQIAARVAPEIAAAKAATAATIAGGLTEGLQQAGQTGREVRDQILALDESQLADSSVMQSLMESGLSFDDARSKLAEDASGKAMTIAGVATGIFGGLGDRVLAKAFTRGLSGNLATRIAKGAAAEGVLEELPQSYLSRVGANVGMQEALPETPTTQGALSEGLGGMVAGGLMGGGMATASRQAPPQVQPVEAAPSEITPPTPAPIPEATKILSAGSVGEAITEFEAELNTPPVEIPTDVGREIAGNMAALPDQELRDFIQSEQRDKQAMLAEQQAGVLPQQIEAQKAVDLEKPTPPREPTAMELAMQTAQERATERQRQAEAKAAQEAVRAQEQAKAQAEQARLPQPEDLPILEAMIKRRPVSQEDGTRLVDKGFARLRDDGSFGINERGFKARNRLLRQEANRANEIEGPGALDVGEQARNGQTLGEGNAQPQEVAGAGQVQAKGSDQLRNAVAPKQVGGAPVETVSTPQLQALAADPETPAITRHAAVAAIQARQQQGAGVGLPNEQSPANVERISEAGEAPISGISERTDAVQENVRAIAGGARGLPSVSGTVVDTGAGVQETSRGIQAVSTPENGRMPQATGRIPASERIEQRSSEDNGQFSVQTTEVAAPAAGTVQAQQTPTAQPQPLPAVAAPEGGNVVNLDSIRALTESARRMNADTKEEIRVSLADISAAEKSGRMTPEVIAHVTEARRIAENEGNPEDVLDALDKAHAILYPTPANEPGGKKSLSLPEIIAKAEAESKAKPSPAPAAKPEPASPPLAGAGGGPDIRSHVEALIKRRSAADQIGKSRAFNNALSKAKDAMAGKAVNPKLFKMYAAALKQDQPSVDALNAISEALKGPVKAAPAKAAPQLLATPTGQPVGGYYATDREGMTIGHRQPGDSPRRFKTAQMADLWARQELARREKAVKPEVAKPAEAPKVVEAEKGASKTPISSFFHGDSMTVADVESGGDKATLAIKRMGGGQSDMSLTVAMNGKNPRVLIRFDPQQWRNVEDLIDFAKSDYLAEGAKVTMRQLLTNEARKEQDTTRSTAKTNTEFNKKFGRNPSGEQELKDFAELQTIETLRFKTHANELKINILKARIASNPDKWNSGDGVGWRVSRDQINRGFRVAEVDAESKQARIVQVADTGLTSTGGNFDRIKPQWVHIADLVRDRKYDAPSAPTPSPEKPAQAKGEGPKFSKGQPGSGMTEHTLRLKLQPIIKRWKNAPSVTFHGSMSDASVPEAVKTEEARQRRNGATGKVEGVYYAGSVHLFADAISSPDRAVIVMLHETIGHAGLRGAFGDNLKMILHQIANVRKSDVTRKAAQYGLDMSNFNERLKAAEEVLADMAATRPEIGFVRRAIAEIRRFLRKLGVKLELTDDEIITNFLIPARQFIEGGERAAAGNRGLQFQRGEQGFNTGDRSFDRQMNALSDIGRRYGWQAQTGSDKDSITLIRNNVGGSLTKLIAKRNASGAYSVELSQGEVSAPRGANALKVETGTVTEYTGQRLLNIEGKRSWTGGELFPLLRNYVADNPNYDQVAPQFARSDQTDTPEFKKWWTWDWIKNKPGTEASKVVDAQGKPLVVYHGTMKNEITTFYTPSHFGSKAQADTRMLPKGGRQFAPLTAYPVYLNLQNPKRVSDVGNKEAWDREVALASDQGYDGLVYLNTAEGKVPEDSYVAFHPEQIKSAVGNRGTFDPTNPNILFSLGDTIPAGSAEAQKTLAESPAGKAAGTWEKLAKTKNRIHDALDKLSPLGALPEQDTYLIKRYRALGRLAKISDETHDLYAAFRNAGEHAPDVYAFLTNKDAQPTIIRDAVIRERAVKAKATLMEVGQKLVDQGLLPKEVFEAHRGEYLPRIYLRHLLDDDAISALSTGKKPSDMGYLKARKDIPEDVRRLILGEITDPAYLVSKAYGTQMRDIALLDWLSEISEERAWVLPHSLVAWDGRKVTPFWLKETAKQIRRQALHYTESDRKEAKSLADRMDETADKALEGYGGVPDGWKQIPSTPRYGRLRGLIVKGEIYDDIVGSARINPTDASVAEKVLGNGGIATKLTQLWKWSKVAANPPAQIRNFVSNGVLLHLSGVRFHMVIPRVIQAIREIRTNGEHWQIAKKFGVTESTFAAQELFRIEREFLDLQARGASPLSIATAKNLASKVMSFTSDIYQLSEAIFKTAKIIDSMQKGQTQEQSVLDAQKWMFDYSLVTPSMRYLRNAPIGAPFITFYFKALPRLIEVATTHPLRLAPYLAIPYVLTAMLAGMADVDDDDVDKLKKALPEWLQERGNAHFLPMKDDKGRWVAMDIGYFLPWTMWQELGTELVKGEFGKAMQNSGMLGGPLPDLIAAIKNNKDPFSKKEIVSEFDPPAKQIAGVMGYLYSMSMPTWLTNYGFAGHMYNALNETVDKHGQIKDTEGQAMMRLFGVNLYPINPEQTRADNLRRMKFEIQEEKRRRTIQIRDLNLTPEKRAEVSKEYAELIKKRTLDMMKYAQESRVHPNLSTGARQ